jgi:hypothetical protein
VKTFVISFYFGSGTKSGSGTESGMHSGSGSAKEKMSGCDRFRFDNTGHERRYSFKFFYPSRLATVYMEVFGHRPFPPRVSSTRPCWWRRECDAAWRRSGWCLPHQAGVPAALHHVSQYIFYKKKRENGKRAEFLMLIYCVTAPESLKKRKL